MKKLSAALSAWLFTIVPVAAVVALSATATIRVQGTYGFSLFLGAPFVAGAAATLLHGRTSTLRTRDVLKVTTLVAIFSSLSLLALGTDGVVCVLMTFPVAVPLALLGGIIAHWVNTAIRSSGRSRGVAVALFPPLWLAMAVEPSVIGPPDLQAVSSVVEIKADATRVWRNVVAFPPINASVGLVFRLGIAYPTSATISGEGVGAIRRCNFSTGAFVEPITRWLPGHELAFSVVASPPPMTETSFYSNLKVPHLSHTFESERGRFLLTATDHGTVLLEGTTWYRQRLWPQFYWNGVADLVIHKIHERVLGHIKRSAERS